MADKNLQSITFPGLTDRYVVPQVDNTLTQAGRPADAKKTGDEISELKADLTAVETDIETGNLTAGTAEQLLSDNGMTDRSPYLFRAMPTGAGDREEPVIVGGSVVWNQLVQNGNFSDGTTGWSVQNAGNGSISAASNELTYTIINPVSNAYGNCVKQSVATQAGHKYLFVQDIYVPKAATVNEIYLSSNRTVDVSAGWNHIEAMGNASSAESAVYFGLANASGKGFVADDIYKLKNVNVIDITQMFGSTIADYIYTLEQATAGAGIAWLRKYGFFTQDYYPYTTEPTFKHVEGLVSHKMTGFNQWDEEWEVGSYTEQGEEYASTTRIRTKNYIKCISGAEYYVKTPETADVYFYDAEKAFISRVQKRNGTFTTPDNTAYIRFCLATAYGTTYKNDICINLSDPAKNGTYEPYKSHTYPLDTDVVLMGLLKLDANNGLYFDGDKYYPDGTVKHDWNIVDLGTLAWALSGGRFGAQMPSDFEKSASWLVANPIIFGLESKYTLGVANAGAADKLYGAYNGYIYVNDSAYSDSASFKAALSGTYLLYKKGTPTTETADPYAPLQLADPYGTEEWVLDDEAFPMPVGQETFYPENLRAKIEGLPWNFANLIAPTESGYTATRAYTSGQLFIVNNTLYQATTSIASGGTITPGTNCTATTLAEVISAL